MSSGLLNASEVADQLGISTRAVYDLANSGTLPCYRVGAGRGAVRFEQADIDTYKASCRSVATRKTVAGVLNLTASSLAPAGSALENAFRKIGVELKRRPSTAKNHPDSTQSPRARRNLQLVSRTPSRST